MKQRLSSLDSPGVIPANVYNLDLSLAIEKFRPGTHTIEDLAPVLPVVRKRQGRKVNYKSKTNRCVSMPILSSSIESITNPPQNLNSSPIRRKNSKKLPQLPAPKPLPEISLKPRAVSMLPESHLSDLSAKYRSVTETILEEEWSSGDEAENKVVKINTSLKALPRVPSLKASQSPVSPVATAVDTSTSSSYSDSEDSGSVSLLSLRLKKSNRRSYQTVGLNALINQLSSAKHIIIDDDNDIESLLSELTITSNHNRIHAITEEFLDEMLEEDDANISDGISSFYTSDDITSTELELLELELELLLHLLLDFLLNLLLDLDFLLELLDHLLDLDLGDLDLLELLKYSLNILNTTITKTKLILSNHSESNDNETLNNEKLLQFVESYLIDFDNESSVTDSDVASHCRSSMASSSYNDSLFSSKSSDKMSYRDNNSIIHQKTNNIPEETIEETYSSQKSVSALTLLPIETIDHTTPTNLQSSNVNDPISTLMLPKMNSFTPSPLPPPQEDVLSTPIKPIVNLPIKTPQLKPLPIIKDLILDIKKCRLKPSNRDQRKRDSSLQELTQSVKEHVRQRPFSFALETGKNYAEFTRYFTPPTDKKKRSTSDKRKSAPPTASFQKRYVSDAASYKQQKENYTLLQPLRSLEPTRITFPSSSSIYSTTSALPVKEKPATASTMSFSISTSSLNKELPSTPCSRENRFGNRQSYRHVSLPARTLNN